MLSLFTLSLGACYVHMLPDSGRPETGENAVIVETVDSVETADTVDSGAIDTADTDPTETAETAGPVDTVPLPERTGPIVLYAVRHAEKDEESQDGDPGLTEEGQARAEALAVLMAPEPLAAIYATDLKRTQETVQPTADDHGLPVETTIDPEEDLADWILRNHDNQTILHAGHSYTLEDFFDALGAAGYTEVDGYGQLWILTIDEDWSVSVTESTYGV